MVPDFVKAGIVVNGTEEQALRDHLAMHSARHDSCEKLNEEVFDITRANRALGTATTSSPKEVDALRRDKGKGTTRARVKITSRRRTLSTMTRPSRRRRSAYCGKLGHRKSECWKLAADKNKSTSEGKPRNINELGATGSGPPQVAAPTGFGVDGVGTRSRRTGLHLNADTALRCSCLCVPTKLHIADVRNYSEVVSSLWTPSRRGSVLVRRRLAGAPRLPCKCHQLCSMRAFSSGTLVEVHAGNS